MLASNEEINHQDLTAMIEKELERIYQGGAINIDPEIKELVRESVQNLPKDFIKEFESQLKGYQNQSEEVESQIPDELNNRRSFEYKI